MKKLTSKIESKEAVIGVIGLGYVGLPLSIEFVKHAYNVVGIDIDNNKLNLLDENKSYINDISDKDIETIKGTTLFEYTSNYSFIKKVDCLFITVPTPLSKTKTPDLSYIENAMFSIVPYLHKDMLIVLESTVYPGATRELIGKVVKKNNFTIGKDIFIVFSPERVDPGNKEFHTGNIPKVVGGITDKCTKIADKLYKNIIPNTFLVNSPEEAEMSKLLENTFRAVNISLVNEMTMMCDRMGIDIWSVIEAASTKPFGFMRFNPGPGLGGHCIPLDPTYLQYQARVYDFHTKFIELATDINGNMPRFVLDKLIKILNNIGKSIKGSKILLVGVAYKENVNDIRESPALKIIRKLKEKGYLVRICDPYIKDFSEFPLFSLKEVAEGADCLVLLVDHREFKELEPQDFLSKMRGNLIIDTRGVLKIAHSFVKKDKG